MRALSQFELGIYPSNHLFEDLVQGGIQPSGQLGEAYAHMISQTGQFTHVFLLPWLIKGGADLVALHHINYLTREFGAKVLVITTENRESPWIGRLPQGAVAIEFGRLYASKLTRREQQLLLVRLLLKVKAPIVHNINCELAWEVFARHGRALGGEMKLFASIFCFEYSMEMEPLGYARNLETAHSHLTRLLTDNQAFIESMKDMYGIKDALFDRFRYPQVVSNRFSFDSAKTPRILWAGRFERQKRPDILLEIARRLPSVQFDVYGAATFTLADEMRAVHAGLSKMKNVHMMGSYNGFESIPANNHALLLYTTQWDGLPNVVLEALSSGLPVLAPDIGGIREVVDPEGGFLIEQYDDVDAFVAKIVSALTDPSILERERSRAIHVMRTQHSPAAFTKALEAMPDYLPPAPTLPYGSTMNSALNMPPPQNLNFHSSTMLQQRHHS